MSSKTFETIDDAVCDYLDKPYYQGPRKYWNASSAGTCLLKQFLNRKGEGGKRGVNYSYSMQAYDGDGIHAKLQKLFEEQGILLESEVAIVDDEMSFKGKPDAVIMLKEGPCLLDIKTQNQKAWARRTKNGDRIVDAHHRRQVLLYWHFLRKSKYPDLMNARIYYVNRNTGEREEFSLKFEDGELSMALDELKTLNEYLASGQEPPKTDNLNDCMFCDHKARCGREDVTPGRPGKVKARAPRPVGEADSGNWK